MAEWTDEELRATVRAYLGMLRAELSGINYSKVKYRRELRQGPLRYRSDASIEYRMRNISSVLSAHQYPTIRGYVSATNVGASVADKLWDMVLAERSAYGDIAPGESGPITDTSAICPPIVYFNVGWMKRYSGISADDETIGAHGYLAEHRYGFEAFNFAKSESGTVRGYRPPGNRERVNITKMGAPPNADAIDGSLVIWLAREPESGQAFIVGWYLNATVFRTARESLVNIGGKRIWYSAEAAKNDAVLLPPELRTFRVESSRTKPGAGFGQKPTWYGAKELDERVWEYVQSIGSAHRSRSDGRSFKPPRNNDPELRRKVEKAAINHAVSYYETLYGAGCVRSVEAEAKGWDLEVFVGSEPLLVEVKGLLNSSLICELTPNEYEQMMLAENRRRYVVYVVNNAIAVPPAVPIASVFECKKGDKWFTADGRELLVTTKIGAILKAAS